MCRQVEGLTRANLHDSCGFCKLHDKLTVSVIIILLWYYKCK